MKRFLTNIIALLSGISCLLAQEKGLGLKQVARDTAPIDFNRRMALIIGNGDYEKDRLKNPLNDALAVKQMLEQYGFQVMMRNDLNRDAMNRAINEFGDSIRKRKGVNLFYYSGHGIQYNAQNYLLPLESEIQAETDIEDQAVRVNKVYGKMANAQGLNLILLDACRSNAFHQKITGLQLGLADEEPPANSFIFFATGPGKVALDGEGSNSPFTEALVRSVKDSMEFFQVVKKVIKEVKTKTGLIQQPAIAGSPEDDFIFTRPVVRASPSTWEWKWYQGQDFSGPSPEFRNDWSESHSTAPHRTLFILSIGISRYKNLINLRYGDKDAMDMASVIKQQAGPYYDSVVSYLLTNDYATRIQILSKLDAIGRLARAGDMVLVFFAGHNLVDQEGRSFFMSVDARSDDEESAIFDAVEYELIQKKLSDLPCKSILFLDGSYDNKSMDDLADIENGVAVLTSADLDQPSFEDSRWQNGLFAKALMEGLTGFADEDSSGFVNFEELAQYVRREVRMSSQNRQVPRYFYPRVMGKFKVSAAMDREQIRRILDGRRSQAVVGER